MTPYEFAIGEIETSEVSGSGSNPRILEYASRTTLKAPDDETSWCSAFVNWCVSQAGIKPTGLANARSWLSWGVSTKKPVKGDICVFWRGHVTSWQGHVGFYAGETKDHIIVLGGNQNNKVCFMKYPKSRLLDIRHYA